ncbi:MAG: 4Fe-4S binding protein [Campylobacterales bacterium]|nr:4Fe-4S binding protein [Campylobacterales bacterium]
MLASEFVYYSPEKLEFPLNEEIFVTTEKEPLDGVVVSNSSDIPSEITALEIGLYASKSKDPLSKKIKRVYQLYQARSIAFDYGLDLKNTTEVGNRLLIVAEQEDREEFMKTIDENLFDIYFATEEYIKDIAGTIGSLEVLITNGEEEKTLELDQIVWFEAKDFAFRQKGTFDPNKTSITSVKEQIEKNIGNYQYKKFITYNSNICQYHERQHDTCGKCEDVCPTNTIIKVEESRHLEFNQIDCHGCGGCISICPSGAVDYAPMNKDSFFEISKLYKDTIPLVVPQKMMDRFAEVELEEDVLPFMIEGEKFLSESHLLTLLQESGSSVIFFTDFLSKGTNDSINLLNEIYQRKYGKKAIYVAETKEEVENAQKEAELLPETYNTIYQTNLLKRSIFSKRLQFLVDEEDLGSIKSGQYINYGKISVNQDSCTLCLSCVEACNVGALIADSKENALKINSSICTGCSYCVNVCPEKNTMDLEEYTIDLNPSWFTLKTLAKDTLFPCVQCGKEFATTKSVMKIANMMAPIFKEDEVRKKTLYCCPDCKPKVMFESQLNQQLEEVEG